MVEGWALQCRGPGRQEVGGGTGNSLSALPLLCSHFSSDYAGAVWKLNLSLSLVTLGGLATPWLWGPQWSLLTTKL